MKSQRITFKNKDGLTLSAKLDLPINTAPHSYAIFAHCFTCGKNVNAIKNINTSLTNQGFAVLSFDFAGLGASEGRFEDTTFTGNLEDLKAAALFLEQNYKAPELFVGHSLGGAAVIFAASEINSVKAVATIGAPSDPVHVGHLIHDKMDEMEQNGKAAVVIGGRSFVLKKDFMDDLPKHNLPDTLKKLKKAVLFLHSPQDKVVEIENAAKLYTAARHPKSFVTLDGSDHLLTKKEDSLYAGSVIASWAKRYVKVETEKEVKTKHQTVVMLTDNKYTCNVTTGKHNLIADEPESLGGNDFGPAPYELLNASLGACTAMTLKMYAERKEWDLKETIVHINHYKDENKKDVFERIIEISGNLDDTQRNRLLDIANKCPVHKTLHSEINVTTKLAN